MNPKMSFPTDDAKQMKRDFVSRIERAQMDPTSHLDTYISEKTAPFKMVTGVVPATTPLILKSEQKNII